MYCYFSHCGDEIPDRSNLSLEDVLSAPRVPPMVEGETVTRGKRRVLC